MAQPRSLLLLSGLVICGGGAVLFWAGKAAGRRSPPAEAAFTGSATCRRCHPKFYELWSTSHHGLAMQPVTAQFARNLRMDGEPVRIGDVTYSFEAAVQGGSIVEHSPEGTAATRSNRPWVGRMSFIFLPPWIAGAFKCFVSLRTFASRHGSIRPAAW